MLSERLQQQAKDKIQLLFCHGIRHPLLCKQAHKYSMPKTLFTQRGKIAASAHLQTNIININPRLYEDNIQYFLDSVLAHELAHLLVHQRYAKRVKPHGPEWQMIMTEVFDLPALVTHSLDVSKVAMKSFMYACDCGTTPLSTIRHNRVQNRTQAYQCKTCKRILKWAE